MNPLRDKKDPWIRVTPTLAFLGPTADGCAEDLEVALGAGRGGAEEGSST